MKAVNNRGKEQSRLSRSSQFVVTFTIARNITTEPGSDNLRTTDDTRRHSPLQSPTHTFTYENRDILYSMQRIVEYGGEEIPVTLYWDIEEFLMAGTYKADIFANGHHIGTSSFNMEE